MFYYSFQPTNKILHLNLMPLPLSSEIEAESGVVAFNGGVEVAASIFLKGDGARSVHGYT
jgi:hypothetical protein